MLCCMFFFRCQFCFIREIVSSVKTIIHLHLSSSEICFTVGVMRQHFNSIYIYRKIIIFCHAVMKSTEILQWSPLQALLLLSGTDFAFPSRTISILRNFALKMNATSFYRNCFTYKLTYLSNHTYIPCYAIQILL